MNNKYIKLIAYKELMKKKMEMSEAPKEDLTQSSMGNLLKANGKFVNPPKNEGVLDETVRKPSFGSWFDSPKAVPPFSVPIVQHYNTQDALTVADRKGAVAEGKLYPSRAPDVKNVDGDIIFNALRNSLKSAEKENQEVRKEYFDTVQANRMKKDRRYNGTTAMVKAPEVDSEKGKKDGSKSKLAVAKGKVDAAKNSIRHYESMIYTKQFGGTENKVNDNVEDITYKYINDLDPNLKVKMVVGGSRRSTVTDGELLDELTPAEKNIYNGVYNAYGKEKADEYLETLKVADGGLSDRYLGAVKKEAETFAKDMPVLAAGYSVYNNVLDGAMGVAKPFVDKKEAPVVYEAGLQSSTIRQTQRDSIDSPALKVAYDVGMGVADMGAAMALGYAFGGGSTQAVKTITGVIMSSSAGSSAMSEARDRGYSDLQVASAGIASAAIEMLTERFSIEVWFKEPTKIITYLVQNYASEASEEFVSNICNTIADTIIGGDKSRIISTYNELVANGYTEQEATQYIFKAEMESAVYDSLVGGLTGFAMGSARAVPYSIGRNIKTKAVGRTVNKSKGATSGLIGAASVDFSSKETKKYASRLENKINNGKTVSEYQTGKLYDMLSTDVGKYIDSAKTVEETVTAAKTLNDMMVNSGLASVMYKQVETALNQKSAELTKPQQKEIPDWKKTPYYTALYGEAKHEAFTEAEIETAEENRKATQEAVLSNVSEACAMWEAARPNGESVETNEVDNVDISSAQAEAARDKAESVLDDDFDMERGYLTIPERIIDEEGYVVGEATPVTASQEQSAAPMDEQGITNDGSMFSSNNATDGKVMLNSSNNENTERIGGVIPGTIVAEENLTAEQREAIDVAETRGVTVKMFEPLPEFANFKGFCAKDGTVYISTTANIPIQTAIHEFTHYGERNTKKYKKYRKAVLKTKMFKTWIMQEVNGAVDIESAIEKKCNDYIAAATELNEMVGEEVIDTSFATAEHEVIAEFSESELFHESGIEALKKENGVVEAEKRTIVDYIKAALRWITQRFSLSGHKKMLANKASELQRLERLYSQMLEDGGAESSITEFSANANYITVNMSEEARYNILKDKKIQPQILEVDSDFDIDFDYLKNNIKSVVEKDLIKKLRSLGYLKNYNTKVVDVDFDFTGRGLNKSLNSQEKTYGGNKSELAKIVMNLQKLLDSSILVETHTDRMQNITGEDRGLKQVYVLCSSFIEGESLVPVQFEIKQYTNEKNRLYLAVALTKIETSVMGNTAFENQMATSLIPVSTISISDLFANINPKDRNFLKYVPNQFLNAEQIAAKNIALAEERKKYSKKPSFSISLEDAIETEEYIAPAEQNDTNAEQGAEPVKETYTAEEFRKAIAEAEKRGEARARGEERQKQKVKTETKKISEQRRTKIGTIMRKSKWLADKLLTNSSKKHIPEGLKDVVIQFLLHIDYSSARKLKGGPDTQTDMRFQAMLERVIDEVNKHTMISDGAGGLNGNLDMDPVLLEKIEKLRKDVNKQFPDGKPAEVLRNLSVEQLETLERFVTNLSAAIKHINETHVNNTYKNADELGKASVKELKEFKKTRNGNGGLAINWSMALPIYAFERMGKVAKSVYDGFMDGADKLAELTAIAENRLDSVFQKYNVTNGDVRKWESTTHKVRLGPMGEEFIVTEAQIMDLYNLNKREQARSHMTLENYEENTSGQGVVFGKFETRDSEVEGKKGKRKHIKVQTIQRSAATGTLSEGDIKRLCDILTDKQKAVADGMFEFMPECANWGNEISMHRYGYKGYNDPKYWPIETAADFNDTNAENKGDSLYALMNASHTKNIVPHAKNPIMVRSVFEVYSRHVAEMARFNAFTLPVLDAIRWLNYTETEYVNEKPVRTGVRNELVLVHGENAKQYIYGLIKDINGAGRNSGIVDNWLMKQTKRAKVAAVGFNLRVALLQPTSYIRAGQELSYAALLYGATKPNVKAAVKHCGIVRWKTMGYYETDVTKSIEDRLHGNKTVIDKITDKSLALAGWMDERTLGRIWSACEYEIEHKKRSLQKGSKEYYKAVADLMRTVVYKTQVVDSVLTRSARMRDKDGLAKIVNSFMSEPILSYNQLMDAWYSYKNDINRGLSKAEAWKKNWRHILRNIGSYTLTAIVTTIVETLFDILRDEDDEELLKKINDALFGLDGNLVSNLNPFEKIPVVADAITELLRLIENYSKGDTYLPFSSGELYNTGIINAIKSLYDILKIADGSSNKNVYAVVYNTVHAFSQLGGVAASNALREIVTVWNNTAGVYDDKLIIRRKKVGNKVYYEKIYDAIGDKDDFQAQMDKAYGVGLKRSQIMTGIKNLMLEDKELVQRIEKANKAMKKRDETEKHSDEWWKLDNKYQELLSDIVNEGFPEDVVLKAVEGYKTEEQKDAEEKLNDKVEAKAESLIDKCMKRIYESNVCKDLNSEQKAEIEKKVTSYAYAVSKADFDKACELSLQHKKVKAAESVGIDPVRFYSVMAQTYGNTKAAKLAAVNNSKLTDEEKADMRMIVNATNKSVDNISKYIKEN